MIKKQFKKIYIEITNICNLSCPFCPPDNRKKEYMSINHFEMILNKIKDYTDYIYLHVKGEPLIHPDINEFIELAHHKGFKVNITTNGTLMDYLKNKNIRQLNYSMQSTDDIEKVRETIRKIKVFIKNTDILVSLRLWSEKSQLNQELKEMLLEEFNTLTNFDDVQDKKELAPNIFLSIEEEFKWPDLDDNSSSEGYCYGLKDQIAILVDGTVVPCCLDHRGNMKLGNIYIGDLKEILESERSIRIIKGFQNRKAVEELCQKCNFKTKF